MREFIMLSGLAIAISGALCFLLFWPLVYVHLRDRQPAERATLGSGPLTGTAVAWFLLGRFRRIGDRGLSGLAAPAQAGLWVSLFGLALAFSLYFIGLF
ncbi:hypothetical protein [Coralloluteibacterium thermophilus]|uniref:DUF1761 domain-containing protein n=1 Tax=Coralloluteibacterium thermophilum TaxID=2707049 RepID=A0ABV9NGT8_9GAMM